ncbi:MAG: hypothetical protein EPO08_20930 [Rhodospirillaceae bacterium]|nr:MAG: hypothetical protein EPO08_20930 [Rhodospirillaceae bacterium]
MAVQPVETRVVNPPSPPPPTTEIAQKIVEINRAMAAINVMARILAVRLFLFLSILGSFVLALYATADSTLHGIYIVVAYASTTTFPLALLEWKSKSGG